jgi:surface protein
MKSLVTLFAALLLVFVLLVITGHGTDKSLRSPSRGLSDSTDVLKEINKATFPVEATTLGSFGKSNKGNKGNKGSKGNKSKKGKKGKKGTTPQPTESPTPTPTPAPTPAPTLAPTTPQPTATPCLNDVTFRTALTAWFYNSTNATSTYGNITDWCTRDVTDMSFAFNTKTAFNEDISGWDVSSVTDMFAMFR